MKKLLILLLILFLIGILWIGSNFWTFSKEEYINDSLMAKAKNNNLKIDGEYVIKNF